MTPLLKIILVVGSFIAWTLVLLHQLNHLGIGHRLLCTAEEWKVDGERRARDKERKGARKALGWIKDQ